MMKKQERFGKASEIIVQLISMGFDIEVIRLENGIVKKKIVNYGKLLERLDEEDVRNSEDLKRILKEW